MSNSHRLFVCEKPVHFRWGRDAQTHELTDATLHGLEHRQIVMVDQKRNLQCCLDLVHAKYVIEVRMSCNNLARLDFEVVEEAEYSLWLIAGIDDQCCCV